MPDPRTPAEVSGNMGAHARDGDRGEVREAPDRVVLLLLLGVSAAVLASCRPDHASGGLGAPITAGDYQLIVANMENPAPSPDRFTNPKPGNRFVKFDVSVVNQGRLHLPLAAGHFTLRDSGDIDNPARPGIPSDTGLRETSIPPGQAKQALLYFEMAANQRPAQLVFTPNAVGWNTRITVDLPS